MIPFNKPYMTGKELWYITEAHKNRHLSGDGEFTKKCSLWLQQQTESPKVLLTHSCTAALEMTALIANIQPGDEIIMPSYTFVSTANAFVLRGGVPVFVDIRPDTLNIDETKIEAAITKKTKAIVPVHYAGISCEMNSIMEIAKRHNLFVIEDAAQGVMARYHGKPLGSIGHLGAYSFHETKNVISGEGGALLVNKYEYIEMAEVCREKGTNRSRFFRGEVDKYTWQDVGSSYLPGELVSAFLWAQLEEAEKITNTRLKIWNNYHALLQPLEQAGYLRRPIVPEGCQHNAHLYYILLSPRIERQGILNKLKAHSIGAVFHYVPLHSSPAGSRFGKTHGDLQFTDSLSEQLIRLPLWIGISFEQQQLAVKVITNAVKA